MDAFEFALSEYETHAIGYDEVRPVTGTAANTLNCMSSLIDAMGTSLLMGLTDHYNVLRDYVVSSEFTPYKCGSGQVVSSFETIIRVLGGLESAYVLSGHNDTELLCKTVDVIEALWPAFDMDTGIPVVWTRTYPPHTPRTKRSGHSTIAECGTLQLELSYLTELTGTPKYRQVAVHINDVLASKNNNRDGTYPQHVEIATGSLWGGVSAGSGSDSFYEYLVKMVALHKNGTCEEDKELARKYDLMASNALRGLLKLYRKQKGYWFMSSEHLACFAGGMYALGAHVLDSLNDTDRSRFMQVAANLTEGCYMAYATSKTGLSSDNFNFGPQKTFVLHHSPHHLRPETIESIFYMWRYTHDQKYREWGWRMFQSLDKVCRNKHGFTNLGNPDNPKSYSNEQPSWLLAETFKYYFLLFSDDSVIPLDKYVFTTEAHPLPIINKDTEQFLRNKEYSYTGLEDAIQEKPVHQPLNPVHPKNQTQKTLFEHPKKLAGKTNKETGKGEADKTDVEAEFAAEYSGNVYDEAEKVDQAEKVDEGAGNMHEEAGNMQADAEKTNEGVVHLDEGDGTPDEEAEKTHEGAGKNQEEHLGRGLEQGEQDEEEQAEDAPRNLDRL